MYTSNLATAAALVGLAAAAGVPRAADAYPAIKRTPNWCGQINRHSDIVEVEATWKVPTVSLPAGASTNQNYYSLTWIGTGGDAPCGDTGDLFQAGTSGTIKNGVASYALYYEMWPSTEAQELDDITVSAGDEIYCKVTKDSTTKGTFYWENKTTGQTATTSLSTNAGRTICSDTVEWIQERPGLNGGEAPFPDWTEFSFYGASAKISDGSTLNLQGSTKQELYLGSTTGSRACHSQVTSDTSFDVLHN